MQRAERCGIDVQLQVNDLSGLRIPEADCTVVLANLFDNAIEACAKLPAKMRWIDATVALEDDMLFFSLLNASPPVRIFGDRIETDKGDPMLHGFGLPNVKEILRRSGAVYGMNYRDGRFQFTLEWPNVRRECEKL